jgi:hypothetical protein
MYPVIDSNPSITMKKFFLRSTIFAIQILCSLTFYPIISHALPADTTNPAKSESAYKIGDLGFTAATVGANFTLPVFSYGGSSTQFGFNAGTVTDRLIGSSQFELDAGYQSFSSSSNSTENGWNLNGAYFWNECNWRFGPVLGYQSTTSTTTISVPSINFNESISSTSHAFNYGAFGEWDACSRWTYYVKGGGFSSDPYGGYYFGAGLEWYLCEDFDFCGDYDYLSNTPSLVRDNYSIRADWLVSESTPITISAGFTFTDYPYNYTVDQYSLGIRFLFNGPDTKTLEDRQRNGELINYGLRF